MNDITFEQAWNYGGPLMWVLALFSVWALALVIYLWYSQRAGIVVPEAVSRICASKDPESEGGRVADRLMSQVEWLADLGAIAPLVGLLGTVLGMFKAFSGVANNIASAKTVILAQGVSQAIITTVFGLAVSIPVLAAYAFFRRRAQRRIAEVEEKVVEHFASLPA